MLAACYPWGYTTAAHSRYFVFVREGMGFMARFMASVHWFSLAAIALLGCQEPNEYVAPPPQTVTVAQPLVGRVTNYLEETGTVVAVETVEVRPQVKGMLLSMHFEPGQTVAKDDLLYLIDPDPYQAELDQSNAQLEKANALLVKANAGLTVAEAALQYAEARYNRNVPLAASGTVSQQELEEYLAERDVARASITEADAAIVEAKAGIIAANAMVHADALNLGYTRVTAPIAGRIGKNLVDLGNLVGYTDPTHLNTIVSYDPIYAQFTISESTFLKICGRGSREDGDETSVPLELSRSNDQGYPYTGMLEFTDSVLDETTGTYLIRAIFDNPSNDLVPGLFVRIRVPLGVQENALLVPEMAIGSDQSGRFVLVVDGENKVERRAVTLGRRDGNMQVVNEGLQANERIVIHGIQRARPGSVVAPEQEELPPLEGEEVSNTIAE